MWGGYPGSVGPTISRPDKRHQRVISWHIGSSQAHQPTLPRLSKSSAQSIAPEPQPSLNLLAFSSEPSFSFSLEERGSPSKGLLQLQSYFVPHSLGALFSQILYSSTKNIKVLGARGGVLLVFLSLSSIVVSPSGLNKYTRGHRTQGTAFHLAFKRMTNPGLVK